MQTAWNLQHRLQGQCEENPPLNGTGEQQAQAVSQLIQIAGMSVAQTLRALSVPNMASIHTVCCNPCAAG